MGVTVSDCGKYAIITPSDGCDPVNRVFVADIGESWNAWVAAGDAALADARGVGDPAAVLGFREGPCMQCRPLVDNFDAEYLYLGNDGRMFWFKTNLDAPSSRIISITLPEAGTDEAWEAAGRSVTECVGESPSGKGEVLEDACIAGGSTPKLVLRYLQDVVSAIRVYDLADLSAGYATVALPAPGSATRTSGESILLVNPVAAVIVIANGLRCLSSSCAAVDRDETELLFGFESFVHAGSILRLDLSSPELSVAGAEVTPDTVLHTEVPGHNPDDYVSSQEIFTSLDGTRVPMFLCYHKATTLPARSLLYGYGGFSISLTPYFSAPRTVWMREMGGVFALASLRGGAEYGEKWHKAGALSNKHCCFEDFVAAAEHLHATGRSTPALTAIQGGSNGGLLTLACSLQRPELFGAVISQVPVTDMLRFHKFTIGAAWCSEFGNPDEDEEVFRNLMTYSPLHNVTTKKAGDTQLPATLICTADHDDRVVPSHTFKMLATLQAAAVAAGPAVQSKPLLGRIEVDAGHGAGKPLSKVIGEVADLYAFMEHEMPM
jgi:prolyl oligopeptidase